MTDRSGKAYWLLLSAAALSWCNTGVLWLMQLSGYQLWHFVGSTDFAGYHQVWWRGLWGLDIVPSLVTTAIAALLLRKSLPKVPVHIVYAGFGLLLGLQVVNVLWFLPLERQMVLPGGGMNHAAFESVRAVNWLRIVLMTAYAVVAGWMAHRAFAGGRVPLRGRILLYLTSALGLYAVGNVWLVQLVCYRLWAHVGRAEAFYYHEAWWHSIWGVLFIPAGLVFLSAIALLWKGPSGVSRRLAWTGTILQLVIYASTAVWWGPLMARLVERASGLSAHDYQLMMSTHWIRLALITAYGATAFWMLVKAEMGSGKLLNDRN